MSKPDTWEIGDVKITRIEEMEPSAGPPSSCIPGLTESTVQATPWLYPSYADEAGWLRFSFHAFILESAGRRIIVDTCVGNDKVRSIPKWHMQSRPFLEKLTAAGFAPETIDYVLCTHMHIDHVGWNTRLVDGRWVPTFPKARYLFARQEWDHWHRELESGALAAVAVSSGAPIHNPQDIMDYGEVLRDSVLPIVEAGLHTFVETDHAVTPEVSLHPTPGHTPGHVSVRITSGGATAMITGDLAHSPLQLAFPELNTHFDVDPDLASATRAKFANACADHRILILGTHFPAPSGGYLVDEGESRRFAPVANA